MTRLQTAVRQLIAEGVDQRWKLSEDGSALLAHIDDMLCAFERVAEPATYCETHHVLVAEGYVCLACVMAQHDQRPVSGVDDPMAQSIREQIEAGGSGRHD